jgi:hypothetical protein
MRKDPPMRINRKSASIFVSLVLAVPTFSVTSASAALPNPFELELKAASKVTFGKGIPIALPDCKFAKVKGKFTTKCTYGKFIVTVNSFKYHGSRQAFTDVVNNVYAIDIKMENYSKKIDSGLDVGAVLRCKNEISYSPFYRDESDSIDPQNVPAGSELSGVIYASLPDDFTPEQCQMPTLWLEPFNSGVDMKDKAQVAEVKKKKLISRAYIPLTPEMLAAS